MIELRRERRQLVQSLAEQLHVLRRDRRQLQDADIIRVTSPSEIRFGQRRCSQLFQQQARADDQRLCFT